MFLRSQSNLSGKLSALSAANSVCTWASRDRSGSKEKPRPIAEWQEATEDRREASRIRISELWDIRGPDENLPDASLPDAALDHAGIYTLSSLLESDGKDEHGTASCGTQGSASVGSTSTRNCGSTASTLDAEASIASDASLFQGEDFCFGTQQYVIRVIDPVKRSRRVETKRTLASFLLGEGSKLENILFKLAVQNWKISRLLWSLWFAGAVFGLLTLLEWVPVNLVWFSMLMLPLPGFTTLVLSVDLLREVLEQFEFFLVCMLQVSLAAGAVIMLQDLRAVFWFCYSPTMIIATFMDAYPPRYRCRFSRMFFSGMIFILIFWTSTLTFGLVRITDIRWRLAYLEGKCASMSCHIMLTLTAFCCKHLYFAIWRPDHLVIIKNSTRTMHVPVRKQDMSTGGSEGATMQKYVRLDRQQTALSLGTITK